MLNVMPVSPSEALKAMAVLYAMRKPVFLHGQPGIGKSELIAEFAAANGMALIDLRLTTLEAVDLRGLCSLDKKSATTRWLRPEFFPVEDKPGIIFLDELTAAEQRLQASAYELILNRRVGKYALPSLWWVVGAGNGIEDGAICYQMGSALADRFCHLRVVANPKDWIAWAQRNSIHPAVSAFIQVRPDYLAGNGEQSQSEQLVVPSPRSWKSVSDALQRTKEPSALTVIVNGLVGESAAVQFFHTMDEIGQLPRMEDILALDPRRAAKKIPATISALYGLTYSLVAFVDDLSSMQAAIRIFEAVATVSDNLPRREIQTLAMELLLAKAYQLKLMDALTASAAFLEYAPAATEIAS